MTRRRRIITWIDLDNPRCLETSRLGRACDRLAAERHFIHRDPRTGVSWVKIERPADGAAGVVHAR